MNIIKIIFYHLILISLINLASIKDILAKDPPRIIEIRAEYTKWQKVIKTKLKKADVLYMYYDNSAFIDNEINGDTLENNKNYQIWVKNKIEDISKNYYEVYDKYRIIKDDKLGTYINIYTNSLSGDWGIITDYYYDKNDKLIFIYYAASSLFGENGLALTEKRLYFDEEGNLIRNLEKTFDPDTKKPVEQHFKFNDVEYNINLKEMDFHSYWKKYYKDKR